MRRGVKAGFVALVLLHGLSALGYLCRELAAAPADRFEDAYAAYYRGDFATALRLWRPLAEHGNAYSQFNLGVMYYRGQGIPQGLAEAMRWFREAADQGDAQAEFSLGFMYKEGDGVPQDYAEAVKWFGKAAEQGNILEETNLGLMYDKGDGVPQDYAEAVKWFRKAADQGNDEAEYRLAHMYAEGNGVPQDYAETARWYQKALEQGYYHTQASRGLMYLRKAADQGNADAQFNLGGMYEKGYQLPQDYAEAAEWYRKAADQGYA